MANKIGAKPVEKKMNCEKRSKASHIVQYNLIYMENSHDRFCSKQKPKRNTSFLHDSKLQHGRPNYKESRKHRNA